MSDGGGNGAWQAPVGGGGTPGATGAASDTPVICQPPAQGGVDVDQPLGDIAVRWAWRSCCWTRFCSIRATRLKSLAPPSIVSFDHLDCLLRTVDALVEELRPLLGAEELGQAVLDLGVRPQDSVLVHGDQPLEPGVLPRTLLRMRL